MSAIQVTEDAEGNLILCTFDLSTYAPLTVPGPIVIRGCHIYWGDVGDGSFAWIVEPKP